MQMIINEKSAELIGMHIGDGTLYRTTPTLVWELRGCLEEKDYYCNTVKPLLESVFGIPFMPKFRSGGMNGCFGIQTTRKDVAGFFVSHGFAPGRNTHIVRVPQYIFDADLPIQLAFLRGLFDTDGCLHIYRINNQERATYPRIEICSASKGLIGDLKTLLLKIGFRHYVWGSVHPKIAISGKEQVGKWFTDVRPHNAKHLNKYHFWREKGYYMPRSLNLV
jgi:hypothetical protein